MNLQARSLARLRQRHLVNTRAVRGPTKWLAVLVCLSAIAGVMADEQARGESVYRFYCYQCHGYDGTAQTLASRNLNPPPRDFVDADPDVLDRARMIDAVSNGRAGTAMVGFAGVLEAGDIEAVVDYVRDSFMHGEALDARYHTPANGWTNHRKRYETAYPFVLGEIPLSASPESLSASQRIGLDIYFKACISCHDQPMQGSQPALRMDARPVSFPRGDYSHKAPDAISEASYYAPHDRIPALPEDAGKQLRHGQQLFIDNCAFCHGNDATGRNWIGEFIEPKAANLVTSAIVRAQSREPLIQVIRNGIDGSSMPAWRLVLTPEQIEAVAVYLRFLAQDSDSRDGARGPG